MDDDMQERSKRFAKDVSLLIVGAEGVGKTALAKSLLNESSRHETPPLNMQVGFLSKISIDFDLLDVDLVVVLIDLTKKNSLDVLPNINSLEYRYLLGKLCFIVLGTKQLCDRVINVGDIQPQLACYNSPVFYCGFKKESEFEILSRKLMNIILIASGLKPGVSPTVFNWNCAHPLSALEDLIGDS